MDNKKQHSIYSFTDFYKNEVSFSFDDHPFSLQPKHVFVICVFESFWLLTKHKGRGLEFPGGKVEAGEKVEEAAIREVKEETGGKTSHIYYIGQYKVVGKKEEIFKNIYFAQIEEVVDQSSYFETDGPVLLEEIPYDVKQNELFSFIMKDDVLTHSLQFIKENRLQE